MPPTMWHRGASLTPVASHDDKVVAANVLNGNRSNATPHSDDVRTGSTAVDADGQSEHVSRGAAASRGGGPPVLSIHFRPIGPLHRLPAP